MSNEKITSHILNEPTATNTPQTATRVLKKRGRKGDKIAKAFAEVPSTPVDFEEYAAAHDVKCTVLRQIKRHDSCPELGKVFVRKNKVTKKMMIWRNAPEK